MADKISWAGECARARGTCATRRACGQAGTMQPGMGCASPPLRVRRALLGAASSEGSHADRDRRRGDWCCRGFTSSASGLGAGDKKTRRGSGRPSSRRAARCCASHLLRSRHSGDWQQGDRPRPATCADGSPRVLAGDARLCGASAIALIPLFQVRVSQRVALGRTFVQSVGVSGRELGQGVPPSFGLTGRWYYYGAWWRILYCGCSYYIRLRVFASTAAGMHGAGGVNLERLARRLIVSTLHSARYR